MKQFNVLNKLLLWNGLFMLLAIAACNKKDDYVVAKPELVESPANKGQDTITLGDSLLLHPKLMQVNIASYSWQVNGETKSADSIFTFKPTERGNYEISFKASNEGGEVNLNYKIHVWGRYENGFFIVNEGWYGHGTGTLSFYRYNTAILEDSVFIKENPDKDLKPASSTLQFGTIYRDNLYLVAKANGPVVVADAYSLKETKRIAAQPGYDWRAFVGIDEQHGLLSSTKGIYRVNLETMELGEQVDNVSGQVADLMRVENHIFAISQGEGLLIINANTYSVEKKITGMQLGFAQTPDGSVWAAGGTTLLKINPSTLNVEEITLPFQVYGSWGAWHPSALTASTVDNSVFIPKNSSWTSGNAIYKYDGTAASLQQAFITLPSGKEMYGAGFAYDPQVNQLVVSTVNSGYNQNNLYFYNANTGQEVNSFAYEGYYFPSVAVFHE